MTADDGPREPTIARIILAAAACVVFVVATRLPVARATASDSDEQGYLVRIVESDFPKHHTLFLAAAKGIGNIVGDPYRGFVLLDVGVSALAMVAAWWFLRAVASPAMAAVSTLILGASPLFWAYGAMAANYSAILLVGSFLLGIAVRGRVAPRPWHPYAAAVALGLGTGYRPDIGPFWLPILLVILWRHRWVAGLQALLLFAIANLAWFIPMLRDAGGWALYRDSTGEFAEAAGWKNSVWVLGASDGSLRYAVKAGLALAWTLGLGLVFVPLGLCRFAAREGGPALLGLMALAALPALAFHLLIHFGVPGYGFHYVPTLLALMAVGLGSGPKGIGRGLAVAATLALTFLFYPSQPSQPGFRGQFDMAFARYSRSGLASADPVYDSEFWPTANSRTIPPSRPRRAVRPVR